MVRQELTGNSCNGSTEHQHHGSWDGIGVVFERERCIAGDAMGNSLLDPFSERTRANTRDGFWKPIENKAITDDGVQRRYGRVHREYGIRSAHVRTAFTGGSGAFQRAYGDVFTAGTGIWPQIGAFLQCRYGSFSSQVRRGPLGRSEGKAEPRLTSRGSPEFPDASIVPSQGESTLILSFFGCE
jgi:hypothetical protein